LSTKEAATPFEMLVTVFLDVSTVKICPSR